MKSRTQLWFRLAWLIAAAAIVVAVSVLVLASFSAYQRDDEISRRDGGWMTAQVQVHYLRLMAALDRYYAGEQGDKKTNLISDLDAFWSDLPVILDSKEAEGLRAVPGTVETIEAILQLLPVIDTAVTALRPGERANYLALRAQLETFGAPLSNLLVVALRNSSEKIQAQRDDFGYRFYVLLGIILLTGAALAALLIREMMLNQRRTFLLEAVLDNMQQGLVAFDKDQKLLVTNKRFLEMTDVPLHLAKPGISTLTDMVRYQANRGDYGPGDPEIQVKLFVAHARNPVPATLLRTRPNGMTIEVRANPLPPPQGGYVATYSDVTLIKENERALLRAKEAAEAANHSKSAFLANMSHELRTPLNAIIGFSEVMSEQVMGPIGNMVYLNYAADIHRSGQHLLSLIEDVLDLSKIEAGKMAVKPSVVDMEACVDFALTSVQAKAESSGISISKRIQPELASLWADERMCRQICLNLIANAVKFTQAGGHVEIGMVSNPEHGFELRVTDTGIGIADEHQQRVLEPFYQVETAFVRTRAGTGLGLPLTKELLKLHGGSLHIDSQLGRGTTVRAVFPKDRLVMGGQKSAVAG